MLMSIMFFHMGRALGLYAWDIDDTFKWHIIHLLFEGRHLFGYTLNSGMPTPVSNFNKGDMLIRQKYFSLVQPQYLINKQISITHVNYRSHKHKPGRPPFLPMGCCFLILFGLSEVSSSSLHPVTRYLFHLHFLSPSVHNTELFRLPVF